VLKHPTDASVIHRRSRSPAVAYALGWVIGYFAHRLAAGKPAVPVSTGPSWLSYDAAPAQRLGHAGDRSRTCCHRRCRSRHPCRARRRPTDLIPESDLSLHPRRSRQNCLEPVWRRRRARTNRRTRWRTGADRIPDRAPPMRVSVLFSRRSSTSLNPRPNHLC
jgi:hypothetical protein